MKAPTKKASAKAKSSDAASVWPDLSAEEIAPALGVTATYIRRLNREGVFPKATRGRFNVRDVLSGMQAFWKDEARRNTKVASASRVSDAKADLVHLQIEERSKRLVEEARTEAIAACDQCIGGLLADLMAVPARVTSDLALRLKLETALNDVLGSAAKRARGIAAGMEPDSDAFDASQGDDA